MIRKKMMWHVIMCIC